MNSPPGTTDNPRTANRLCTSLTSTAIQLCKGRHSPKERNLYKAAEATEGEEAGTTEAEGAINLLTKNTGKIRNALIAIRRDAHQKFDQRQKRTLTTHLLHIGPATQKV